MRTSRHGEQDQDQATSIHPHAGRRVALSV
jgi:hypothetical protein